MKVVDQMWDNAFMMRIKNNVVKMTTDNSDNGAIMLPHCYSARFQLFDNNL